MTTDNFLQKQKKQRDFRARRNARQYEKPPPVAGFLTADNQYDLLAIRTENSYSTSRGDFAVDLQYI
jgi:hypothetical protein